MSAGAWRPFIPRALVEARRHFSSALIHGSQVSLWDVAGSDGGVAVVYCYAASSSVVAVLNPQAVSFQGTIPVHSPM
jgi:hypothetical protein